MEPSGSTTALKITLQVVLVTNIIFIPILTQIDYQFYFQIHKNLNKQIDLSCLNRFFSIEFLKLIYLITLKWVFAYCTTLAPRCTFTVCLSLCCFPHPVKVWHVINLLFSMTHESVPETRYDNYNDSYGILIFLRNKLHIFVCGANLKTVDFISICELCLFAGERLCFI